MDTEENEQALEDFGEAFDRDLAGRMMEIRDTPEYKKTPAAAEAQSQRSAKRIASLMKMSGLSNIDPETPLGKAIQKRGDRFAEMRGSDVNEQQAEKLIQLAVETEILKDAALTMVSKLRAPKDYADGKAFAYRQALKLYTSMHQGYTSLLMSIMRALRGEGSEKKDPLDVAKKLDEMKKRTYVSEKNT
jgi:hypothetical protein